MQGTPSDSDQSGKKIVEVACWACRKRKAKCTGERPACSFCIRRNVQCEYEYGEGLTRVGNLRLQVDYYTRRADDLQFLFDQLRSRSDPEAACLLAIIRLGVDIDIIVERLRTQPDLTWTSSLDITQPEAADVEAPVAYAS